MTRPAAPDAQVARLALRLGVLWGVATVGWRMLRSDGLERQSWDLQTVSVLLWGTVAVSLVGAATLTVVYRFSRAVYERPVGWLLLWTPWTMVVAGFAVSLGIGAVVGFYTDLTSNRGFDLVYWGVQWALPGNGTTVLGAVLAHAAAFATHLVLRRAYRASVMASGRRARVSWPVGVEWLPWLMALIPGLVVGAGYAQQDPVSRAVVKILWCGAMSVLIFRLSRHTYRRGWYVQSYWAPLSAAFFLVLCGWPEHGISGALLGSSFVFQPQPLAWVAAYAVQLAWRGFDRQFGPSKPMSTWT